LELSRDEVDILFHALADATRRDIVAQTLDRERSVSDLGRLYPISLTAVQKHVDVLAKAGLVTKQRNGRESLVRGEVTRLRDVQRLLDHFEQIWRARIERFDALLSELPNKEGR
jgi:DNA-binding transcriptional ArsR family regulator